MSVKEVVPTITVEELYNWAKEHNAEKLSLSYTHNSGDWLYEGSDVYGEALDFEGKLREEAYHIKPSIKERKGIKYVCLT